MASCAQLATVPDLERCPAGATAAAIPAGVFGPNGIFGNLSSSGFTWPAANVSPARLDALGVDALGIIAATFPLLARITGPEAARNE